MKLLPIFTCVMFLTLGLTGFAAETKVLRYDTEITTDGKKLWKNYHISILINSPNDNKYCEFEIPYSKIFALKKLSGSIKDLTGNEIRKLSKKEIITSTYFTDIAFYSDNMMKRFNLVHNQYPYVVEVNYKYEYSSFISIADWSPVWDYDLTTDSASLTFTYPDNYQFRKNIVGVDSMQQLPAAEGYKSYKWSSSYNQNTKRNILMPPRTLLKSRIQIAPLNFNYIKDGSFASWEKFGEWEAEISNGLDVLTVQEQIAIDNLLGTTSDPQEIVKKLYHYLQDNCRYTLVEIDFGGMQPYPADYVCKNRYGDCKALTNYMKALLKYKKIESYPVLVSAGEVKAKIIADFPSQQFNHVFLCVPMPNDTIWLECTSNTSPPGYLGTFTHNRKGLLVSTQKSKLVDLPALKDSDCQGVCVYNYFKPQNEKTIIETYFRYRGDEFEQLNSFSKHATDSEKDNYIEQFLPLKNIKVLSWEIVPVHRDSARIDLKAQVETGNPYLAISNFLKVDHPFMMLPSFEKVKDRFFDVMINYPISTIDTINYSFDFKGMKVKDQDHITVDSKYGHFEMKKVLADQTLTVVRKLTIPNQTIPIDEYADFYKFYQDILTAGKSTLLLKLD